MYPACKFVIETKIIFKQSASSDNSTNFNKYAQRLISSDVNINISMFNLMKYLLHRPGIHVYAYINDNQLFFGGRANFI